MAVPSSPASLKEKEVVEKKSRSKCPGVRVVGGRIYDSENGKTCHQCRQKTMDFAAGCTNLRGNKLCTLKFCHKCLLNRYGEKAEDVALLDDWQCPKCRGICNCSFCMKKQGHKPTGMLVHIAKDNGFSSVSELLQVKGSEILSHNLDVKDTSVSPKKPALPKKESIVTLPQKLGKENSFNGNVGTNLQSQNLTPTSVEKKFKKTKGEGVKEIINGDGVVEARVKENGWEKTKKIGLDEVNDGLGDGKGRESAWKKKKRREGQKEVNNASGNGKASLMESGLKKPRITKEVSENEVKTYGTDKGDLLKKKKSKTHSKELSKEEVTRYEKDEGVFETQKKSEGQTPEGLEKELKNGKKDAAFFEKNRSATQPQEASGKEVLCGADRNGGMVCSVRNDDIDIQLPHGTCLTAVAGIELPPEDVGNALQFLEFCVSFGKVLGLKNGQAEAVLGEIVNGRRGRRSQSYYLMHIHTWLLSLIQKDIGEESPALTATNSNSWFEVLGKCVSKGLFMSREIPSDWFDKGNEGYDKLSSSEKLRLLNFLCDEALDTKDLRSWIDDENFRFLEKHKEAKEKVLAAKDKEKILKKKMLAEVAKAVIEKNSTPISISDHAEIVSQIKIEAAQAHVEIMEAKSMVPKKRQACAVRTDPILMDVDGRAFWKLNGYNGQSDILLQDMGAWDSVASSEKWLVYAAEQKQEVEKYISSLRTKRLRVRKVTRVSSIKNIQTISA